MRKSLSELIETCINVKCQLQANFEVHYYEDGAYTEFQVEKINDLPTLLSITKGLEIRLFCENNKIVVRIFEDYKEY